MTDRRRAIRFIVSSAAPGQARIPCDVLVERVAGTVATIIAPAAAQVGEPLVIQASNADGSLLTWEGRVRSSTPLGGDSAGYRIELRLTDATRFPRISTEGPRRS